MHSIAVKVKFLRQTDQSGNRLEYATSMSAGIDLRAFMDESIVELVPGQSFFFPAGISIEPQHPGVAGFIFSRSGLGTKKGLVVCQGVGVIDPDYRGEILVCLRNTSQQTHHVKRGQRIAQLVFMPFYQADIAKVEDLCATTRGSGGFGHTGNM
ncbi:dUTP diphosphatase [Desulfonatronovibrio magnus]|uniref:dUTP diphosphatase n=1 Tax=Desulfonatronovibrio magnus TaxID=698827 RepID=UPI0005EBD6DD|nr:dUTP diphosphatase [Desulfonatronovibrio magnus]